MPALVHKKTSDMDGICYSPDDSCYRIGPVNTFEAEKFRIEARGGDL